VCEINDPGHTCDEYLVLLVKSGLTGLLNKLVHLRTCLAGGPDCRFKCVTLGIRKVQLGRVKCVHADPLQCNGMGFKCVTP
jgi:hypothetical protein